MKSCSEATAKRFWRLKGINFSASDLAGMSGGLLIIWNTRNVDVICSFTRVGYLGVKILWMGKVYYICNVYSSCCVALKSDLWNRLLILINSFVEGEWVVRGDFNAVKNGRERKGRIDLSNQGDWEEFSGFINDKGLVDVPCKGKKLSWFSSDGRSKVA